MLKQSIFIFKTYHNSLFFNLYPLFLSFYTWQHRSRYVEGTFTTIPS